MEQNQNIAVGICLVLMGIIFGLYIGIYKCFLVSIVNILEMLRGTTPIDILNLGWNIIKIMLSGTFGWICGIIPVITGLTLLTND